MAGVRKPTQKRGWAFAACVGIVKPPLLAFTKRRWIDADKLPARGGCVVVANHISHLDPFTMAHFLYDNGRLVRFLAKAEVFDVPVGGRLVRHAGQIPVYRKSAGVSQAFRAAVQAAREGECVVVYPEGTITRDPDLWPMTGKSGAARIALTAEVPVIPVAQWGVHEILAPYSTRLKLLPRHTVTVKAGDPVDLDDLRGRRISPGSLRLATDRIMDAVTALLADIRQATPPQHRYDPREAAGGQTGDSEGRREP